MPNTSSNAILVSMLATSKILSLRQKTRTEISKMHEQGTVQDEEKLAFQDLGLPHQIMFSLGQEVLLAAPNNTLRTHGTGVMRVHKSVMKVMLQVMQL